VKWSLSGNVITVGVTGLITLPLGYGRGLQIMFWEADCLRTGGNEKAPGEKGPEYFNLEKVGGIAASRHSG
jgi:hypothetical protein